MKALAILLLGFLLYTRPASGLALNEPERPADVKSWTRSEKGIWLGGYNLWYKFDSRNKIIKFSRTRKKWDTSPNAAWQDNKGSWFYIYQGRLISNSNGTWEEVGDKAWQDLNGHWFRFNQNWELEESATDS